MKPLSVDDVVFSGQTACVLEVSVDKPGNVGPNQDFSDTRFEDYLLSAVSIGPAIKRATEFGILYEKGKSGIGGLIKDAVEAAWRYHNGGNTNLGLAMLLIPLSASCGICIKEETFSLKDLRRGVESVIDGSTPQDTIDLYDSIILSNAEVGRSKRFDVKDPDAKRKVLDRGLNLRDIFELSSWDSISKELTTGMEITFEVGYPSIVKEFSKTGSIKGSVLRCFFEILSRVPDTLIERKNNREVSIEVSNKARTVLDKGLNEKDISAFNSKLRDDGNRYNPGTTADLTASSLMVSILDGALLGNLKD